MAPLRIVFLGSDIIALPLLEWLVRDCIGRVELVGVFTQPDRPVGRGQKVVANGIKSWAIQQGLPVLQPEKLTEEVRQQFAALAPDVALVMAYGHILRDDFIATPRLGTLNLHASVLPRYRGASPIQTAIANGERETGVSLMRIVRRLDAGPVADVERVAIDRLDTALEVEAKLAAACVPLMARNLDSLSSGTLEFVPQRDVEATFCRRLEKPDGAVDFSLAAAPLAARINGLFPWPGCSVEILGQPVKFGLADSLPVWSGEMQSPGCVLGADAEGLLVQTTDGVLRLRRLQRPGGKMLTAADFLRGYPIVPGTMLPSTPMTPLVASTPFRK